MTTGLKPCPFCKDGENNIRENYHNPTMSGGIKEPISVDITHWCKGDGLPRRRIIITGRTRQEAIEAWNSRTPEVTQPDAVEGMVKLLRDMLYAIEKGAIDSEIVEYPDPETGFRGHQFHDEWAHYAKKALAAYRACKENKE